MMRRCLLLSLVFVLAGLALSQTTPSGNWIAQGSTAGSFTALFPIAPKETTDSKSVEQGDIVSHMFMALSGDLLCGVGYTDYPIDIDVEKELTLDRDNFAKAVNASVSSTRRKDFTRGPNDQLPALDFTATSDNGTFKGLVIVVNRRAYIVVTFNRKGSDRTADIERFFASFKLTSKKS
jgi:hypothetical protein